ncbi:hypothetical protein G6F32_000429 [Rhizopus arrhizus]|nr:hypothetical protein G6F24_000792 [Rhizopus arrhizus]KAG0958292.1 hypothetical protein G6F32_000429 [Rhizopus arrhizus]
MKAVSINCVEPSSIFFDDLFSKSLYTNSNLSRIVLHRPIRQTIRCGDWNRIDLRLMTEMGLPVDSHYYAIGISATLLVKQSGCYTSLGQIESRPILTDAWEPEIGQLKGFEAHTSLGVLEYKVEGIDQPFFIILQSSDNTSILPLCVGPIRIKDQSSLDNQGWHFESLEQQRQQYRALKINGEQTKYFLIKEQWEDGTPGKIWDSALVMVDLMMNNYDLLLGKRILDLSAGTGYIGLSIAQLSQSMLTTEENRPSVTLSDIPEALDLIKANQLLNGIESSDYLKIEPLYWGNLQDAENLLRKQTGNVLDIIIASDIIYRRNDFVNIISTFQQLCTQDTVIYMGHKKRGLKPHEEKVFFDLFKKALNVLVQNGIVSAPLWSSESQKFSGMLTVSDFINLIQYYYTHSSVEEALKEIESFELAHLRNVEKSVGAPAPQLVSMNPMSTLYDACKLLAESRVHRVPLLDKEPGTGAETIVSVITQYRILKFIASNFKHTEVLRQPLSDLQIGTYDNIATASMSTPVIRVIDMFAEQNISAVPIVDENNVVLNVYETIDVMSIAISGKYRELDMSVGDAMEARPKDYPGVHTCTLNDTLHSIFRIIRKQRVYRLIVVDQENKLIGIVSLSNILGFLVGYKSPQ